MYSYFVLTKFVVSSGRAQKNWRQFDFHTKAEKPKQQSRPLKFIQENTLRKTDLTRAKFVLTRLAPEKSENDDLGK